MTTIRAIGVNDEPPSIRAISANDERSTNSDASGVSKYLNPIPDPAMKVAQMLKGPLSQVGQDVFQVAKGIPGAAMRGIANIPKDYAYLKENAPAAVKQLYNDPLRAARNIGAGGIELGGQISRIPPSIADYLSHIGMIKPQTAAAMPRPFSSEEVSHFGDQLAGQNEQPGDELIRGAVRNAPTIYGAGKVVSILNPMQLTSGAIVKKVLNAKEAAKQEYSGPTGHYVNLFNEARNNGLGNFQNVNPSRLNIDILRKNTPTKTLQSLEDFSINPSHEVGQKAISDLGFIIRPLENKGSLPSWQKNQLEAAKDAKKYIQESMFTDQKGNLNKEFLNKHNELQRNYRINVTPYTTNASIKAYERGELKKADLIEKLSKGKFAAQKGSEHPQIAISKTVKNLTGDKLKYGAIGALMAKLLGQ